MANQPTNQPTNQPPNKAGQPNPQTAPAAQNAIPHADLEQKFRAAGLGSVIQQAGGVQGFIDKFTQFLAAHPLIGQLLQSLLSKWLAAGGTTPVV